ncbi:CinA family protein [Telmatospirillum siberiense]|uniref:Damage-inducible protein CinA n=1 Tax=Telmatospirillum siberiense TaxID=382514 RepID=A0A2N3PZ57_9PROT|nr:CinA family protein [Telmatospirillum siberiense]PKU25704.1 damage-inducible protein CinA [Telmatospirillum siberiense]
MNGLPQDLIDKANRVLAACEAADTPLALAESCTGGLVGASLTAISGSSAWIDRGFITYSNQAKIDMLGVAETLIERFGVVSEEVARAMAEGALAHSRAKAAAGITGIAGPTGGTADKPVGLVHIAAARLGRETLHRRLLLAGDRDQVRHDAAMAALDLLIRRIET